MFKFLIVLFLSINLYSSSCSATIFAASDLQFALKEVKKEFLKSHQDCHIDFIFGSSGKGRVQIKNHAPYDLYFSADLNYVNMLYKSGDIVTKPKLYAIGRLVIWSKNNNFISKEGFDNFKEKWVKKITIANPSHAPYGKRAKEALESLKLYDKLKSKIVFGENISQSANYISIKAVDIGIVALSLVLAPTNKNSKYYLIDDKLHKPLLQGYGMTKYGSKNRLAKEFYRYIDSNKAKSILKRYGFRVDR